MGPSSCIPSWGQLLKESLVLTKVLQTQRWFPSQTTSLLIPSCPTVSRSLNSVLSLLQQHISCTANEVFAVSQNVTQTEMTEIFTKIKEIIMKCKSLQTFQAPDRSYCADTPKRRNYIQGMPERTHMHAHSSYYLDLMYVCVMSMGRSVCMCVFLYSLSMFPCVGPCVSVFVCMCNICVGGYPVCKRWHLQVVLYSVCLYFHIHTYICAYVSVCVHVKLIRFCAAQTSRSTQAHNHNPTEGYCLYPGAQP